MKKAIFIDRDGTIIEEPQPSEQVDTFEKLAFLPFAISTLARLSRMGYELVLATNQDGLGTEAFPEEAFRGPHALMLRILEAEGVRFADQLIDPTTPAQNAPTRKPELGMFGRYLTGEYDLGASYVIGDRLTDMELARNLGARGILLTNAPVPSGPGYTAVSSWRQIPELVGLPVRRAVVERKTRETAIKAELCLDPLPGVESHISTGLRFMDHMLAQLPAHGGISLTLTAKGDLDVDEHHTVEDVAIVLGEAIAVALGNKQGIERYGFSLPMDEACASVLLDFSGRIWLKWDVQFAREYTGDVPTDMWEHFFRSLCQGAKCNLHVSATGDNDHHRIEAIFKALARALRQAVYRGNSPSSLPSSKGKL